MLFLDANFLIYLNLGSDKKIKNLFMSVLNRPLYTDVLVLDEVLYISKRKYGVEYSDTLDFLDRVILPYVNVLSIGEEEFNVAKRFLGLLNPSDALHVASMMNNGIKEIISEDKDFDKLKEVKRIWIS